MHSKSSWDTINPLNIESWSISCGSIDVFCSIIFVLYYKNKNSRNNRQQVITKLSRTCTDISAFKNWNISRFSISCCCVAKLYMRMTFLIFSNNFRGIREWWQQVILYIFFMLSFRKKKVSCETWRRRCYKVKIKFNL